MDLAAYRPRRTPLICITSCVNRISVSGELLSNYRPVVAEFVRKLVSSGGFASPIEGPFIILDARASLDAAQATSMDRATWLSACPGDNSFTAQVMINSFTSPAVARPVSSPFALPRGEERGRGKERERYFIVQDNARRNLFRMPEPSLDEMVRRGIAPRIDNPVPRVLHG